jgi:pyruvate dehydrogenase E2 component (dihydrolipoamide acetyltransferase)
MAEFRMPSLGADMEAGTLVEWLKKPGDRVARGDIIAVVETQKGAIEIEVFETGTIEALLAQPGTKLAVGAAMAFIRSEGERSAPTGPRVPLATPSPPTFTATPVPPRALAAAPPRSGGRASPAARQRAAELGIGIEKLVGSGPGQAVTLADVEAAARAPIPSRASTMREVIAAAMARSKREIPHYYLGHTVDVEPALRWLEAENAKRPIPDRVLYGAVLLKAVARALHDYPEFNGLWRDGGFQPSQQVHLGVAISLSRGGLIAPAIHDADRLSLPQLMAALRDLVNRVRKGGLRSSELSDPTVTVTSLGDQGTEMVFPVIYPPQVAIVGFGVIVQRPWVVGGAIEPRRVISLSLAADHRVSDGHRGARLLTTIAGLLQEPQTL